MKSNPPFRCLANYKYTPPEDGSLPTRRTYLKGIGSAGVVAGLAGCTAFGGGESWDNAIGVVLPLSGPLGPAGKAMQNGVDVAQQELTSSADIEFRTKDNSGTVEGTRSVAKSLIDDNTPIVVGIPASDTALAMREVAEDEEVPYMTIAANPDVTQEGTSYAFRTQGDSEQEVKGQSAYFQSEDVKGLAIIAVDNSFGQTVTDFSKQLASDYGYEVTHDALLPIDTTNFMPEINKIDTSETDAVFTPFPGSNAPTLVRQLKESGVFEDVIHLGNSSYGSNLFQSAMGQDIVGVNAWSVDTTTDTAQTVGEKMGAQPDSLNIPGYDMATLAGKLLQETDSHDPTELADALRNISYDAAYGGPIEFGENGHNVAYRAVYGKWQTEGGEVVQRPAFKSESAIEP